MGHLFPRPQGLPKRELTPADREVLVVEHTHDPLLSAERVFEEECVYGLHRWELRGTPRCPKVQ